MADWAGGYVSDLEYSAGFYGQQSPSMLRLACLLNGIDGPSIEDDFTYCELGCGVGVTSLILAASNPRARFVAVDFNPLHILKARAVARSAGLTNIEFIENGFEQLAHAERGQLPEFDFITLHGVYSWVSSATRGHIVDIIARCLKPGGVAYVTYNSMPGWAKALPVQRLLHDLAELVPGRSDQRILRAMEQMETLKRAGAQVLANNELVDRLSRLLTFGTERYLAHEYLNEHWNPMYHVDVARELASAKLTYAGSANLLHNFDDAVLTPAQREALDNIAPPHLRETLRDFLIGQTFRKDLFVRGAQRLRPSRHRARLGQIKLALVVPAADFRFEISVPSGEGELARDSYGVIVDALAERPRTVDELLSLPNLPKTSRITAGELIGVLVGSHQAAPMMEGRTASDQATADRMTLAVAELFEDARWNTSTAIAVSALGSGMPCDMVEFTVFRSLLAQGTVKPEEIASAVYESITAQGAKVVKEGAAIEGREESLEFLQNRVRGITDRMLPVWQQFWPQLRLK